MTSKQFDKKPQVETLTSMSDLAPAPSNAIPEKETVKEIKKKPRATKRVVSKATGPALERLNWKKEMEKQAIEDQETAKLKAQMAENQKKVSEVPTVATPTPVQEIENADELGVLADKDLFMKERLIPKTTLKNTLLKAFHIMTNYFSRQNEEVKEPKFADRIKEGMQFIDKNTFTQKDESGAEKTKNITWTIKHKLEKKGKVEWSLVSNNGESFIVTPAELEGEIKNGSLKIKS